jgi:enamine deaminase RidA (YjgF/YER057c/UK114 family)
VSTFAEKTHAESASPLEREIGFSRAVRIGGRGFVSGTAPLDENGRTYAPGDVAAQARRCFDIALKALRDVGLGANDVVRTRIMLTDISRWKEAADVHGALFAQVRPACTFIEVSRFIDPQWLVEIEIDAVAISAVR